MALPFMILVHIITEYSCDAGQVRSSNLLEILALRATILGVQKREMYRTQIAENRKHLVAALITESSW